MENPTAELAGVNITYPAQLPVAVRRDDIASAIAEHQVVIVAGETGSGKTTQLPKICLELGRGSTGRIGHTQPRRIAARSVAERIATELDVELGGLVGYQVRFRDHSTAATRLKVMTDGILLAELQHDRDLLAYDTIIIDEAHERSLNIDFLLGYLKGLLPRRLDLKVVITSATIDVERFAAHFSDSQGKPAPIITVEGRTFPVEVRYRPLVDWGSEAPGEDPSNSDPADRLVRDPTEAIVAACSELIAEGPGDILVFLPGEREIKDTAEALERLNNTRSPLEIVPLFARLSAAEQHKVFSAHSGRRIVLSTNVAETSLTVPGIRFVVDTGLARISRFSLKSKVQRLPIEPVSRASANQRSGRCGRVEAGIAIRLYSQDDFDSRPEFTEPEILRTNLAAVILQMANLGLGDVAKFGFVEPPDNRQIASGLQLLTELGALRPDQRRAGSRAQPSRSGRRGTRRAESAGPALTPIGRRLARLPLDPRMGRMVIEAERLGVLREVLVLTAALSLPDPRERPMEHRAHADQLHARFTDPTSDFITTLRLWVYVRSQQRDLSSSAFRRMCRTEHLNYLRLREWAELESQLRRTCRELSISVPKGGLDEPARASDAWNHDGVHQAMLAGLLSHIGLRDPDRRDYLGARGTRFSIFPGSVVHKSQPALVVAAELVETSRLFARGNAGIKPEWAETLGAHLVSRSYSEPHWSKKRGSVMAHERVSLYGVPLIADRLIQYGRVDRALSRELFIRHALVYGEWGTRHKFFHANRHLLEQAEELEHRARRRDLVVDEYTLFDFYDARIGNEVVSGAHFDSWWKRIRAGQPDLLTFDPAMLLHAHADGVDAGQFPDTWADGSMNLHLTYRFDPGAETDGVSIDLPLATLNQVEADGLSWHVPGLRHELVTALIRSLPKQLRVHFVPAPDVARQFLDMASPGEEPLIDALTRFLRGRNGVVVPTSAWDWAKVPAHLKPTYRVIDDQGREVSRGKDLDSLKAPLAGQFVAALADAAKQRTATGQRTWAFGEIERSFTQPRAGHEVVAYPGLVDEGKAVGLGVFGSGPEADSAHARGLRRLAMLSLDLRAEHLIDGWDSRRRLGLLGTNYGDVKALLNDVILAAVGRVLPQAADVRSKGAFDEVVSGVRSSVPGVAHQVLEEVERALEAWRQTERTISGSVDLAVLASATDLRSAVGGLFGPQFISEAGLNLREYPRYLSAARERHGRLSQDPARDRQQLMTIAPLAEAFAHRAAALGSRVPSPELVAVRWMLEELRVSLFAQKLGTSHPVSAQRVRKALAELT